MKAEALLNRCRQRIKKSIQSRIIRVIHSFGYEMIPIYSFSGLENLNIRSIVDVGANRGQFAKRALKAFPYAHIYCFEPVREPFEELKKWAEQQKNRISVFDLAIGEKEEEVKMFLHLDHNESSSMLETTEIEEKLWPITKRQRIDFVSQTTLDRIEKGLIGNALLPEILVKVDVQGYEDRVISGGIEFLKKVKACILEICVDQLYKGQTNFKEVFYLMDSLGFSYVGNLEQVSSRRWPYYSF